MRVIMAMMLIFSCLSATIVAELSAPLRADATTVARITLKAYPLDDDGVTWDTSQDDTDQITDNGGKLRICVSVAFDDGSRVSEKDAQEWADWGGMSQGFTYAYQGDNIQADSQGVITALNNGTTKITVTPKDEDYQSLSASIDISTMNQGKGLIVTNVEIVNADNNAYGDDAIKFTKLSQIVKLYARVTYKDRSNGNAKVVYSNAPNAPAAQKPPSGTFDTLKWQVGDGNYASISVHNGSAWLKALANATTRIYASISGGDASVDKGMGYGIVYDAVTLNIDNGQQVDGEDPANDLTVKVVYESDLKKVILKKTYSISQFEALGAVTKTYTLTQGSGKYVTDKAYGVPIATLLQSLSIDTGDVRYFTLTANDGANPGSFSTKWLLQTTRYYLPNYDIGGSWQEREQVPSMLALKDSWNSGTEVTGNLNSGTRFRLVFGSATSADGATDKSVKFINTFTIVMSGSAPSKHGNDDKDEKTTKGGGSGNSPGAGTGGVGGGTSNKNGSGTSKNGAQPVDKETQWRIYQMMNKSNSNIAETYESNPLLPFALPTVIMIIVAAILYRRLRYRQKMA